MALRTGNKISVKDLAARVGGTFVGQGELLIEGLCSIDKPLPNHVAFLRAGNKSLDLEAAAKALSEGRMGAIFFSGIFSTSPTAGAAIMVEDPLAAVIASANIFYCDREAVDGIHEKAFVESSATLGKGVSIGAFAYLGANVWIDDNVLIHPHVTIYPRVRIGAGTVLHSGCVVREDCVIGKDCILHSGVKIGTEGFGYIPTPKGHSRVPQIGNVEIGDKVEIGSNSCVDRATFGSTRIDSGTKLDNLVQVGHNVSVGANTLICAGVGIGGSAKVGKEVVVGPLSGIRDHGIVTDKVRIAALSGVTQNLTEPGDYGGFPAVEARYWRRIIAEQQRLGKRGRRTAK